MSSSHRGRLSVAAALGLLAFVCVLANALAGRAPPVSLTQSKFSTA
ncbi:MAG TPA: hypothetical protein VH061_07410 [Solirubrobacteraceae bacterium]|jgi:hypothetical protein|nr:hypothetical protein [Solirubrobacteraceae bacterium]